MLAGYFPKQELSLIQLQKGGWALTQLTVRISKNKCSGKENLFSVDYFGQTKLGTFTNFLFFV